jgi:predicted regulator of Ras-like GTPase activity (Roadblock/LC7/MglB family)
VDHDGMLVESVSNDPELDLEALAAELVAQVRVISSDHRDLDVGDVQLFTLTTDRFTIMVGSLVEGFYLLLVMNGEGSYGRARFELRRALLAFEEDLI